MGVVSRQALEQILHVADESGIDRQELVHGTRWTVEGLSGPADRIPWPHFAELLRRLEALFGGPNEVVEVGRRIQRGPKHRAIRRLLAVLSHPVRILTDTPAFLSNLFPHVEHEITTTDSDQVDLVLVLPEPHDECPPFFRICQGIFEQAPCMAGWPPAHVSLMLDGRRAHYAIRVAQRAPGPTERLRLVRRALLHSSDAIQELTEQNKELRRALDELRRHEQRERAAARERLDLERRLLQAQRLESLGVLAGGVAHDFNNLLLVIQTHTDLAHLEVAPESNAAGSLQHVRDAALRAAGLTSQLLSYAGQRTPCPRPISLSATIEVVTDLLRAVVPKPVELTLQVDPELPLIAADPTQLQQVVMNLVTNAADAVDPETGQVAVFGRRVSDGEGHGVVLEVHDNGTGMDEATRSQMFDPFFSTKREGRGLGLASVQRILRHHGASLWVESTLGGGTTVRVRWPMFSHG